MLRLGIATLCSVLLLGCAATPDSSDAETSGPQQVQPDVSLNLPVTTAEPCTDAAAPNSPLDRGFTALVAGRHVEAIELFQQYKRWDGTPLAVWEADIAIAYDSMLSQSPFYDPVAARLAYGKLSVAPPQGRPANQTSLMMRDALAVYAALLDDIAELQSDNAVLAAALAKREEAIKRLRELTLGQ